MRGAASALALFALVAAEPATAATQPPRASPVSSEPNAPKAGEPVVVVLTLFGVGRAVRDVQVLVRGGGRTLRFPVIALGSGRYRTAITFPWRGGWALSVRYGRGSEIPLGKGAIRIEGVPPPANVVARAVALAFSDVGAAVYRSASRGSRAPPG